MFKLHVIIASTRSGRNADPVCHWLLPHLRAHASFTTEVLDLRNWVLPFFQETIATVGDFANPVYSTPIVKAWNNKIGEGDAYLIVTPEYNHGFPAVLKNAIDSVFFSYKFRRKPVCCAAYSIGATGGARAVEALNTVMLETEAVPLRTPTLIPFVTTAFDADGGAVNPALDATLAVMLDDLAWMAGALKTARAAGELPPAALRIRGASPKR